MELDVANDGRVFYIERMTGEVNVWNPANGAVTTAVQIPVDSNLENGGLGIQLAPDFDTTGHIYVAYTPLARSRPRRSASPASRSSTTRSAWRASRSSSPGTCSATECCHSSGSLAFDAAGQPAASPRATTPTRSSPTASRRSTSARAGSSGTPSARRPTRTTSTARSCASRRSRAPRASPGLGTTYTVPTGNLFAEADDTTNQTRPEIYAMGFRNPFRITVDPKTGWVLMGDYGPDAGRPTRTAARRAASSTTSSPARQLRLALLRPRERPVQRLQLRHRHVRRRSSTARRRSTTRRTTPA